MSPSSDRKPKSDAINATRLGPLPPPCAGDSCPNAEEWADVKTKVDEIHEALIGTPETPGYFERLRRLEYAGKVAIWAFGIAGSTAIAIAVANILT